MAPIPALVIFDLGGTTIRDRGEVPAAFAAALRDSDLRFDPAEISGWRGGSKRDVLGTLVARQHPTLAAADRQSRVAEAYARFRAALDERLRAAPDLALDGIVPALERLQAAGIRTALNSGFDRGIVDTILKIVRWPPGLFDAIVCSDDVPAGRPAPFMIFRSMERTGVTDVRRVAVVGDTRLDLEAGANAGVAFRIGVLTGAHDRRVLEDAPATHILPTAAAVPSLWLDAEPLP